VSAERDEFGMNRHRALDLCLSMISAQTRSAFVAREKPLHTFPDHALGTKIAVFLYLFEDSSRRFSVVLR